MRVYADGVQRRELVPPQELPEVGHAFVHLVKGSECESGAFVFRGRERGGEGQREREGQRRPCAAASQGLRVWG